MEEQKHIDEIYIPVQKTLGQLFQPYKNRIIKEADNENEQFYIEGFQYDIGAEICGVRIGEERAANILMNSLLNSELYIQNSQPQENLQLYYNDEIITKSINHGIHEADDLQQIHNDFSNKISSTINQNTDLNLIMIGGSFDQFYCLMKGVSECQKQYKSIDVININSKLNANPIINQKSTNFRNNQGQDVDALSVFRNQSQQQQNLFQKIDSFTHFGIQNSQTTQEEINHIQEQNKQNKNKHRIYWLESDIRRGKCTNSENQQQQKNLEIIQKKIKSENSQLQKDESNQNSLIVKKYQDFMQFKQKLHESQIVQTQAGKILQQILLNQIFDRISNQNDSNNIKKQDKAEINQSEKQQDQFQNALIFGINLNAINSSHCLGVNHPSIIGGLQDTEIFEIIKLIAFVRQNSENLDLKIFLSISGFNPAIETHTTSQMIIQIIYQFIDQQQYQS